MGNIVIIHVFIIQIVHAIFCNCNFLKQSLFQNTPIVKLKEFIEEHTNVPTHHQKLTVGTTVLEDWDKDDNMMFIGDYPAIHYGSVLYIIQHDGYFRTRVTVVKKTHHRASKETIHLHGKSDYSYQTTQFYVNTSQAEVESVVYKIQSCIQSNNLTMANVFNEHDQWKQPQIWFGDLPRGSYYNHIGPNDTIELCDEGRLQY